MISRKLIELVHTNTDKLVGKWATSIKASEHMKTFQKLSDEVLEQRERLFIENLVKWLEEGASNEGIKSYFARVGRERYHENIPLEEINFSIITAKRLLWELIQAEGFFESAVAIYQALELITVIYNYFDFGLFHISREYMEEVQERIQASDISDKASILPYNAGVSDRELEVTFGIKFM